MQVFLGNLEQSCEKSTTADFKIFGEKLDFDEWC